MPATYGVGLGEGGPHWKSHILLNEEQLTPVCPCTNDSSPLSWNIGPSCKFKRDPSGDKSTTEEKK